MTVPGGISGRIERAGDLDHFRFEAKKGSGSSSRPSGRRLGTAIDPVVEVLDAKGTPVPRAVLRPLDQTEVAFREHDSSKPGIRLTRWGNLAVGDYVLIGRELTRIRALPRNPDDDCTFWNERNQRVAFLGTTPEHHPMSQPIYKVSIHPPGTAFPPGRVAPVTLTYRNDDGGPDTAKDARLTLTYPPTAFMWARIEDARGLGGESFGYHLLVRKPRPRFTLAQHRESKRAAWRNNAGDRHDHAARRIRGAGGFDGGRASRGDRHPSCALRPRIFRRASASPPMRLASRPILRPPGG